MALNAEQAAAAGDAYLSKLSTDASVRDGLASAGAAGEIAAHISSVTGFDVGEDDLDAIADHLNTNHGPECDTLTGQYPALRVIIA